jgi:hypothetical protein
MNASYATTPVLRPYLPATADFAAGRQAGIAIATRHDDALFFFGFPQAQHEFPVNAGTLASQ